jgi:chorismate mutase
MKPEESRKELAELRDQIDAIDLALLEWLNRRTGVVEEIGRLKEELGLPVYEPSREEGVFKNVIANNQGPLSAEAVQRIFERIIDEMRSLQRMRRERKRQGESEC